MKNTYREILLGIFVLLGISLLSCNDSDDFGSGLVEDQFVGVAYDEILDLKAVNELTESIVTYDIITRSRDSSFIVANLKDPVFGRTEAIFYTQMRWRGSINRAALGAITCDSVVLDLRIARNILYGDTMLPFNLNVYQLAEELVSDTVFRSNQYRTFAGMPLGGLDQFYLRPTTRVPNTDTTTVAPYIRLKLDPAFGQQILDTPNALDSLANFYRVFKGLAIKVDGDTDSPLFGINILPRLSNTTEIADTKIRLFYSGVDTTGVITISAVDQTPRYSSYRHDISGTPIEPTIGNEEASGEYLFLQGLAGPRPKLLLPDLDVFQGRSVKVALLEFAIATDYGTTPSGIFNRVPQILMASEDEEGTRRVINDVTRFQAGGASVIASQFGGTPVPANINGVPVNIYRMNITSYIQEYIKGNRPNKLELYVAGTDRRPERVVLHGPKHNQFPVKLKLIFTEL